MTADTFDRERARLTAHAEASTGLWYCSNGHHFTKGRKIRRRGRSMCAECVEQITAARQRGSGMRR